MCDWPKEIVKVLVYCRRFRDEIRIVQSESTLTICEMLSKNEMEVSNFSVNLRSLLKELDNFEKFIVDLALQNAHMIEKQYLLTSLEDAINGQKDQKN